MKEASGHQSCAPVEARDGHARAWRFAPAGTIVLVLAVGYALGLQDYFSFARLSDSREMLRAYVDAHYVLSLSAFVVVYLVVTAVAFPAAAVLTILGGFLFGWLVGAMASVVGATAGASIVFVAARTACGDFLRNRVGGFAGRLAKGFERDAFTYLLVLRLAPFIPFVVVNVAPALFKVPLKTYVTATVLGILPASLAYAALGGGLDSVVVAAREAGRDAAIGDLVTPQITWAFAGLALVAIAAAVVKTLWLRRAD